MTEIITAIYSTPGAATNAIDDLIGVGIPREELRLDSAKNQVQVNIANVAEPEIKEILQRHDPVEILTKGL